MVAVVVNRSEGVTNSFYTGHSLMYPGLAQRSLLLLASALFALPINARTFLLPQEMPTFSVDAPGHWEVVFELPRSFGVMAPNGLSLMFEPDSSIGSQEEAKASLREKASRVLATHDAVHVEIGAMSDETKEHGIAIVGVRITFNPGPEMTISHYFVEIAPGSFYEVQVLGGAEMEAEEKAAVQGLLASIKRLAPAGAVRPLDGGRAVMRPHSVGQSTEARKERH